MLNIDSLVSIIESRGYSCTSLEKSLGFGNGSIKKWDKHSPSVDKIYALANFLNFEVGEFLSLISEKTEVEKYSIVKAEKQLTTDEKLLLENYRYITDDKRIILQREAFDMASEGGSKRLSTLKSTKNDVELSDEVV